VPRDHLAHAVNVEGDTRVHEIVGSGRLSVNSLHHQAVEDAAMGDRRGDQGAWPGRQIIFQTPG
jgi:hypothetical protein